MANLVLLVAGIAKAYQTFSGLSRNFGLAKGTRRGRRGRKRPPMKNLLALIGGAVLLVGGAGYYLDWFNVANLTSSDGQHKLQIDVDSNKIKEDLKKGTDKLKGAIDKLDGTESTPAKPASAGIEEGFKLLKEETASGLKSLQDDAKNVVKAVKDDGKDAKNKSDDKWRKAGNSIFK